MKEQSTKFFGIFNCKNEFLQTKFFAFKGKYNQNSKSTGTIIDEIGKSSFKTWYHKNNKSILMAKEYTKKYNQKASDEIILYAYQNNQNNLHQGRYSWLNYRYFPSIDSIKSVEKIPLTNDILEEMNFEPLYILGGLSILTFGENYHSVLNYQSHIQAFYEINNNNPPSQKEIEDCFKRIKNLSF